MHISARPSCAQLPSALLAHQVRPNTATTSLLRLQAARTVTTISSSARCTTICQHHRRVRHSVWPSASTQLPHRHFSTQPSKPLSRHDHLSQEQLNKVIGQKMPFKNYEHAYNWSIDSPREFWYEASKTVVWDQPPQSPQQVLDDSNKPFYRWFKGASLNTCYNALDVHVDAGNGERTALIYDSPVTKQQRKYTYRQMLEEVSKLAGAMAAQGVGKGDRVLIYMPMIPEAVFAMLACARLGAIHSVVFGGFAGHELAKRIVDAKPKMIFAASCGVEPTRKVPYKPMLDEALEISQHVPSAVVIKQREGVESELKQGRDHEWSSWVKETGKGQKADAVTVDATDPLYILYTSGTTGTPKGVVRDCGGHAVALKYAMQYIFDMNPGETFWAASDIGWVVGHAFIVYAPLMHGCTTILYEGKPIGTPDAGAFWRVISEHKVKRMFTAPTAIRAIKKEDPEGELAGAKYDLSHFQALYLAGERADPDTVQWAKDELKVPIIDNYWQTESGWPIISNPAGIELLPIKFGSATKPSPGYAVHVLDDNGKRLTEPNANGNLAVKLPLPPGTLPTLWNAEKRFLESYLNKYEGYYDTSDAGYIDEDGYVWVMSRTDDVLNVAGHRLSSGGIEEVLAHHSAVAEAAVVGVLDKIKGEIPVGFVVLKGGKLGKIESEKALEDELVKAVRAKIGAVAAMKRVLVVKRLPKTRSGKILRNLMRKIADRLEYAVTPTIEDASVLDEIKGVIEANGIAPDMEANSERKKKVEEAEKRAAATGKTTA